MSIARPSIVLKQLEAEFKKNPETKKHCIALSRTALQADYATGRVFDKFPGLLPEEQIQSLCNEFEVFFKEAKPTRDVGDRFVFSQEQDRKALNAWETKIAKIACEELLDAEGHILPEITQLLEWRPDLSQTQVCCIMSAFVGTVNQEVSRRLAELLKKNEKSFLAFCGYVNQSNAEIIKNTMLLQNKVFDSTTIKQVEWSRFAAVFTEKYARHMMLVGGIGLLAYVLGKTISHLLSAGEHNNNETMATQNAPPASPSSTSPTGP